MFEKVEEIVGLHHFVSVLQELDFVLCVYVCICLLCKCASYGKLKFVSQMQPLEVHSPELDRFQL